MNCSQAVLETYAEEMGLSVENARKVASAFAGGMGMGAECGAVTGALMVIGMKHGKITDKDAAAEEGLGKFAAIICQLFSRSFMRIENEDADYGKPFSLLIKNARLIVGFMGWGRTEGTF